MDTITVLLSIILIVLSFIWWELVLLNIKAGRKCRD